MADHDYYKRMAQAYKETAEARASEIARLRAELEDWTSGAGRCPRCAWCWPRPNDAATR